MLLDFFLSFSRRYTEWLLGKSNESVFIGKCSIIGGLALSALGACCFIIYFVRNLFESHI